MTFSFFTILTILQSDLTFDFWKIYHHREFRPSIHFFLCFLSTFFIFLFFPIAELRTKKHFSSKLAHNPLTWHDIFSETDNFSKSNIINIVHHSTASASNPNILNDFFIFHYSTKWFNFWFLKKYITRSHFYVSTRIFIYEGWIIF